MTRLTEAAAREVFELHALFVELFTGRTRDFSRCEAAFAAAFEMVTPKGLRLTRAQILELFGKVRARADFRITIHDIRSLREDATSVLLQYVEEQYRDGETTRRLAVALFETASHTPNGVAWRFLQETWIS